MLSSLSAGRVPVGTTRDLMQYLSHEDHQLILGLESGNLPGHHVLHAPDQPSDVYGRLTPKLDHKRPLGGKHGPAL